MAALTRMMAALLRASARLLPADRREWALALSAEAASVPAGRRRLAWLAGGAWFSVRQSVSAGRLGYPLVFAAAVAGAAWSAWSGPAGDSAIAINRVDVIAIAMMLAGLPWAVRRVRGPVAATRLARAVRGSGYAAVLALALVKAAVERVADAPPNNSHGAAVAWLGEAAFLLVIAGYAAVILVGTARRSPAFPASVTIGIGAEPASACWPMRSGRWGSRFVSLAPGRAAATTRRWSRACCLRGVLPWWRGWSRPGGHGLPGPVSGRGLSRGCAPARSPRLWSRCCPRPPSRCSPTTPGSGTGPPVTSATGRRSSAR